MIYDKRPNLVAISRHMKVYTENYFAQKGYKVHSEFVYNGIDLDKYPFQDTKTNNLLFVGRLSNFKQPHVAIDVARKAGMKLDIVGGTFVDSEDYVKQLDMIVEKDHDITIYKDVPHEFKTRKMQEAKCLLVPSKIGEPFGLICIEGMACGTPVVALNDGAIPEIVLHGKTGFICNTEEEMVEAIKNIDKIDPLECRKRAEEFSRRIMAENYLKLYQRILDNDEW